MITTFLVEHRWVTTTGLVLMVVLGPWVGYWLTSRPRLAGAAALASLVPVAALTLVPTSRDLEVGCSVEWAMPSLGAVELMANVVLFIPPALLFGIALRRPVIVLVGASAASALIELAQAFLTMLGRSCSTNDWLSNTLGAMVVRGVAERRYPAAHPGHDRVAVEDPPPLVAKDSGIGTTPRQATWAELTGSPSTSSILA